MHLMSKAGGEHSHVKAYQVALEAFYARAAMEETEAMIRKSQETVVEDKTDERSAFEINVPGKPWTQAFMREEARELEESVLYANEQNMAYHSKYLF
jgi:hypothetical protein